MAAEVDVLIIGAGQSGLGMAIQLVRKYGSRSFEIVEKSDNIGGTWWVNSYPGCGCDVSLQAKEYCTYSIILITSLFVGAISLLLLLI
jgi:cation diffusion facilitator CzcD-associated flavoprotein CzcO